MGEKPSPFVTLSYVSPDGEEGYPGKLTTSLTYSLSGGMELSVAFSAQTDKPTVVNLTNHSFFNLAGVEANGGGILDHRLTIPADRYLPVHANGIPLSEPSLVDATPFDFRKLHRIGVRIHDQIDQIQIRQGYDHCYCLPGELSANRASPPGRGTALRPRHGTVDQPAWRPVLFGQFPRLAALTGKYAGCTASTTRCAWSRRSIPTPRTVPIIRRRGWTPGRPIATPRCIGFPRP